MSKRAQDLIEQAVRDAKSQGVIIWRGNGAIFDWTGPDKTIPRAVDCTGAVLMAMGQTRWVSTDGKVYGAGETRKGGWDEVTGYLEVNTWWWYRWFRGWSYSQLLEVPIKNDKDKIIGWREDNVCRAAYNMAKRLCNKG